MSAHVPAAASRILDQMPVRRALLSVTDKTGILDLGRALARAGAEILSTGGTAKVLAEAGIPVREVADFTGFPEMLDGRVKTLHPKIHAGLLARRDVDAHVAEMDRHQLGWIDLVCVNLYPFEQVARRPGATAAEKIENIDIGGPSMIRSAAKNHGAVAVLTDPSQYDGVIRELRTEKTTSLATRRKLAVAAFHRTAAYDAAISATLSADDGDLFPESLTLPLRKVRDLRYGENPHQQGAWYATGLGRGSWLPRLATAEGKRAMSYTNVLDAEAGAHLVAEFADPACAVLKHTNPCGAAAHADLAVAAKNAFAGDPVAAFGCCFAMNRALDRAAAEAILACEPWIEVLVCPSFTAEGEALLRGKMRGGSALRLLRFPYPLDAAERGPWEVRLTGAGALLHQPDTAVPLPPLEVKSGSLTDAARAEIDFAWRIVKHVKSNAIAVTRGRSVIGIGAGQMSRVNSMGIALAQARDRIGPDAVLASDAFFPFRDSIDQAAAAGIRVIVQTGGSKRDDEVIAAAKEHGITLVFTGVRHFRH